MNPTAELVYLDYAATTPLDETVLEGMLDLQRIGGDFANASAVHPAGRRSSEHVATAAERLAGLLHTAPRQIVWTSGATESNNLAIQGAARQRAHRGKHLVTMPTEHKAVSDVFRALEAEGFEVTWLPPDGQGWLDPATLKEALRDDTQLVSVMHVNNETGVVQDIARLGSICRERNVLFHVDAAQSVGKLPIDLQQLDIDLLSMTAHKIYGPKGVGALYIADRPDVQIEPLFFGGGQQRRLRPGTLAVPLIAGFGIAAEIAAQCMQTDAEHVAALRDRLWQGIHDIEGIRLNGDLCNSWPGLLNVSIDDIEGESLLLALEPVCVATGSACNSTSQEPSYVLRSMGLSDLEAQSAVRFSLGRPTTREEIDLAVNRYRNAVAALRELAPGKVA